MLINEAVYCPLMSTSYQLLNAAATAGDAPDEAGCRESRNLFFSNFAELKINIFYQFLTIFLDFWIFPHFASLTVAAYM